MDKFTQEQRIALLKKIDNDFEKYSCQEDKDGIIILSDEYAKIQVVPQDKDNNTVIFQLSEIYIEDNNPLWRNLHETLKNRNFNLNEKKKFNEQIEKEKAKQEKLNLYLDL